jgi:hypothetical protein
MSKDNREVLKMKEETWTMSLPTLTMMDPDSNFELEYCSAAATGIVIELTCKN